MTNAEPKVSEMGRYTTKQVAELLEVNVSTVRRHTKAGYLRCGHWRHNGRRFYTGKEILRYYKAQL